MERLTKRVGKHTVIIGCPKAVDRLRKLKQADDEGRYGRWSPVAFGIGICTIKYQCSVCKQYKDVDRPYKYCPHCGALMRED